MDEWTPDNSPTVASWELPFTSGHEIKGRAVLSPDLIGFGCVHHEAGFC